MAATMFLDLEGIDGESQDRDHKNAIEVLGWSWEVGRTGADTAPGSGRAGDAAFRDLSVTKHVDRASAKLLLHCANGEHIPVGHLSVADSGEKPIELLKITMTDIHVTGVRAGGDAADERLVETVTLSFSTVTYDYTVPGARRRRRERFGWDLVSGEPL